MLQAFLLAITFSTFGIAGDSAIFPLGKVPDGWTYQTLSADERIREALPSEVKGVLLRRISAVKQVRIFVLLRPMQRGPDRAPASLWAWIERALVPRAMPNPSRSPAAIGRALNDAPSAKRAGWDFRELKTERPNRPVLNLAIYHGQNRYLHIYLLLRESGADDYLTHLTQLESVANEIRLP